MADDKDYAVLQAMIEPLTQGVNAIATRPQKTFQSVTSTPYALADLEEARNQIGLSTKELNDVLKGREQLGYSLANTLANMPQQQGYGSWLTDFARGFGMGASAPANARMARQQQIYDAQMKDLANRLAFDKAMGETQETTLRYEPVATGKTDDKGMGSGDSLSDKGVSAGVILTGGVSSNYDPVQFLTKQNESFNVLSRAEDALSAHPLGRLINATGVTKALKTTDTKIIRTALEDDLSRLNSAKALELVKGTGSIRIADSDEEKKDLYGPLKDAIKTRDNTEIATVLAATRNRAYAKYMDKAQAKVKKGEIRPDDIASQDEFNAWWNSFFTDPADIKQAMGIENNPAATQSAQPKNTISVGEVRNGYRFKGGNPKKKENWEVVQ